MTKSVDNAFVLSKSQRINSPNNYSNFKTQSAKTSFREVFQKLESSEISWSKHAKERLENREIDLSHGDIEKVKVAIDKARTKGIKDAVIVMDNKLLVASVANRTIITATKQDDMEAKMITNIDGAIFI